ncbi:RNA-directed DNA polymerase [Bacillus mycoides]|uniref:RNA-directed DNA polymerase n=1 Tax=Bacillus mycoides TaxID=1405 RepID=UPI003D036F8A
MISQKDFFKEIDHKFWRAITQDIWYKDVISYKDFNRKDTLTNIERKINSHEYNFSTPIYYFVPKKKGVLRKVKIYNINDICIYYYCVKKIQDKLTFKIKQNENIFGGFRFSADNKSITKEKIKQQNNLMTQLELYDYEYETFLSQYQYKKEWTDYQNMAKEAYGQPYDYYIHIDIAHFYDDINLDILEKEIRHAVSDQTHIIDLLFHFLRLSEKRDLGYTTTNVGVPQEEIGEMSRVLANFYLVNYDNQIIKFLNSFLGKGTYEYLRYSDDMWIFYRGRNDKAHKIIQKASLLLNNLKLHVNENKTQILNTTEFEKHWHFNDWDLIHSDPNNINQLLEILKRKVLKENRGRSESIIKYILKKFLSDRKNLSYLTKNRDYSFIFKTILDHPKIVDGFEQKHMNCLAHMIKNYPFLFNYIFNYINSDKNIYPNIEMFLLKILKYFKNSKRVLNFFVDYLNAETYLDTQHWYARCICIQYLLGKQVSIDTVLQEKIIKTITNNFNYLSNAIEKRYYIYYLNKHAKKELKNLSHKFIDGSQDIRFLIYIQKNNKGEDL